MCLYECAWMNWCLVYVYVCVFACMNVHVWFNALFMYVHVCMYECAYMSWCLIYVYVRVFACVDVHVWAVPLEIKEDAEFLQSWSYRRLWVSMWMLGIKTLILWKSSHLNSSWEYPLLGGYFFFFLKIDMLFQDFWKRFKVPHFQVCKEWL